MLRGEGKAGESTVMNIAAAATNLILDPIFIFSLDMGVAGASWATMLSSVVAVAIGLWFYYSGKTFVKLRFKGIRFKRERIWDVMYVGTPQVLENNIHSMANLLLMSLIIGCGGALGLTLYNIPWKTVHLLMVPAMAIAASMVPIISAARGQKDADKMKQAYIYALKMEIALGLAAMLVAFVLGDFWMYLFSYNGDMVAWHDELVRILWIYIPFMVFYDLISFGSSLLGALKKSQISAATIFIRQALFIVIIFICCQHNMGWVYWGVTVSEILGGVLMTVISKLEFRKVYNRIKDESSGSSS
ncbi:MAG: polysaccharide biosynthesis C-terminal domain-containing protein [Candidatus Methanomethylophilaceae archaeon]|nr:polysaccharide biosynthesis C-terminal domain-containing protein [Candidatus Methanomethylophilaceae archaeon]